MKKILSLVLITLLSVSLLAACGKETSDSNSIIIGVSPNPHEDIVEVIIDDLEEEGIEVELKTFNDYKTPNIALDDGEIDANFFQHEPYLDDFVENEGVDLVSLGGIHIEPMAVYSSRLDSFDDIEDGSEIAIPNDTVNGGRALILLENHGLIKLDEDVGLEATENDIVDNPKDITFTTLEAAIIPNSLDDVDAAVINGNYALEADLNPVGDGLIIEDSDSPYANILAVRAGEEDEDKFTKLLEALQSDKIKDYIENEYNGAIVPAF